MSNRSERQLVPLLMAAVNLFGIACGGGDSSGLPPDNMTIEIATISGDEQIGRVGQLLADSIRIAVTEDGEPAPGVTVSWSTTDGSGTLTPPSVSTDADGFASSAWTLGTAAGRQTARATVAGATGSPLTIMATAVAAEAATLAKAGGDGQSGETSSQLPLPVAARVTDQFGNPVPGTPVNWSATGAAVSAPTAASDAAGLSEVTVTLGATAGPITIVAASDGLAASPLTFNATAVTTTPAPSSIAITVGNDFFRSDRNNSTSPAVDTVAVGGTVTWTWATGAVTHNVTSAGPPGFNSSPTTSAPASHQVSFINAGTYRYYCTLHSAANATTGMVGRIVVK
jgi:adhesin/invasin